MERTTVLIVGVGIVILSLVFFTPVCEAKVAPGDLDSTFGTGGLVTTDFFGYDDEASAIAIDSQGRIVVAGPACVYSGSNCNYCFALARYNIDGGLDSTFGTNGKVITDRYRDYDKVHAIAIDSQGRIIVAGDSSLARYDSDGNLDTTFGTGGMMTIESDAAFALTIDSQDRIISAGCSWSYANGNYDFDLARYNNNGSLDNTFGTNGRVATDFGGTNDYAQAIAIDSSGKIVVAGHGSYSFFAVARYNNNGSLDNTFGTNGRVTTDFPEHDNAACAIAIDSQGRTVAAGYTDVPIDGYEFALARYDTDGNLDTTFGTKGTVTTDFSGNNDVVYGIAIDSSGKIVVTGYSWINDNNCDFALARYNNDGSLDSPFGTDGRVTTDFGGRAVGQALAIDSQGRIVVAGYAQVNGNNHDFALARYLAEEPNPPTGTIQINGGAEATKRTEVKLTLTVTDDTPGKIRMCISNTMTCTEWSSFSATKEWTLTTGNGTKTVRIWFRDVWGNVNASPYSDTIILDTRDPTDGTVTATPGNAQVALEWTGFTDTLSGMESYKVVFAADTVPSTCSDGRVIYSGTDTSYIHTDLTNGKKYGYRVCARDKAGNISTGATANTKPRPELNPPTGSITIKGGAEAAKCRNVTLTLTATDATPGAIKMCISNTSTCTNWTAFAETKSWTLATGNGTKTVNVWFRDVWGNESDIPYSDTILLDTVAPTNGTVTPTPGVGQVTLDWTGFTDTGSGIEGYKVVFSKGSAPASCSEGKQIYNGPDTTYMHTGLTIGTTYYYRVCAIDEAGNTSTGKTAKAKPQ